MIISTFLLCLYVNIVKAVLDGDCELEGVSGSQWLTAYTNVEKDDNESTVFKTFVTTNVRSVTTTGEEYKKYFVITFENSILTIAPSEEFKSFELNEINDENPKMTINIVFTCNVGTATLAFYQPINDLNTYQPTFTKESYPYQLPMPLPGDFSLSCLLDAPIQACDSDITNTQLKFAINPKGDFSIVSGGAIDGSRKCHTAVIKTAKPLVLNQTTRYELTVTDIGNPLNYSSVFMDIEVDEQTALPANPQFSSAYYTASYDNTNEKHVININGDITLEKKDPVASVEIIGDYKDNFAVETIEGIIKVTLSNNLDEETISENVVVLLTLEANILNAEGPGRSVVVIYMPKKECPTTPMPTTVYPTTQTTTECPICTTEGTTVSTCPPCTTEAPTCPTTETATECPVCTTEGTTVSTCPPCTTETPTCATTETATECPVCTTEGTTVSTCPPCTTEAPTCPTTETATECPVCSTEGTTISTCPPCSTEIPTCPTTETTTECPVCTTEGNTVSTYPPGTTEPPILTTACLTTETGTECPVCPTEGSTVSACPPCTTEAPIVTTVCSGCTIENTTSYTNSISTFESTTNSETEYPPLLTTPTTFDCPTTECPLCTTSSSECPSCTTSNAPSITEWPSSSSTECPSCNCSSTVTNCPSCTTLSIATECPTSITTCPPCLTTAVTPTEPRVVFFQDVYTFSALPEIGATVGTVKAIAIPEEEIDYSVKDGENVVPSELTIDKNSGVLTFNGVINVGVYKFNAVAKGLSSGVESTSQVEVTVYIETETAEVLIVKTIEENVPSSIPLPCPNGISKCTYEFVDQYPVTNPALFKYDNGNLLTEAINLQEEEIKDFLNPHFTLNLKLIDTENKLAINRTIRADDTRHWLYLPESIPRSPNTLLVSVVIQDVNDHGPVFDAGDKLTVGYPVKALLNALSPPYLVQVRATDLDTGLNANIRYTTTAADFIVHPKSGVVYPGETAFDSNTNRQFSVVATDMDGAEGGNSTTLDIEVKLLTQQHLTTLTIQNKLIEELDDVLKDLSDKTNLKINYLTATVIPKVETKSSNLRKLKNVRENDNYGIKVTIYALDEDNEPVPSETVQETLEEVEDIDDVTSDTWIPSGGGIIYEDLTNTTGYIAAVSVLASLLVLFMIAAGILYYLKIYKKRKPKPYNSMTEEDSGSVDSENPELNKDEPKRRPTGFVFNPPPVDEDEDETDTNKPESVPNKGWSNVTSPPTYNDPIIFKPSNDFTYGGDHKLQIMDDKVDKKTNDESTDRSDSPDYENSSKKTVSFRPIVEKINIVLDDKQDEDIDIHL